MNKRKRFIITSAILSLGFIAIQFLGDRFRFYSIGALGFISVILFVWSLHESLRKNMTLVTLILPLYYTFGVGLFWFLLHKGMFAQISIVIFFGFLTSCAYKPELRVKIKHIIKVVNTNK